MEQFRGQGLGSDALIAIEEVARRAEARALHLLVRHDNAPAQHLYRSAGFAPPPRDFLFYDALARATGGRTPCPLFGCATTATWRGVVLVLWRSYALLATSAEIGDDDLRRERWWRPGHVIESRSLPRSHDEPERYVVEFSYRAADEELRRGLWYGDEELKQGERVDVVEIGGGNPPVVRTRPRMYRA